MLFEEYWVNVCNVVLFFPLLLKLNVFVLFDYLQYRCELIPSPFHTNPPSTVQHSAELIVPITRKRCYVPSTSIFHFHVEARGYLWFYVGKIPGVESGRGSYKVSFPPQLLWLLLLSNKANALQIAS